MYKQLLKNDWVFKGADEPQWLPAKVPGCVHTDLLENGMISDPFYGTNEKKLQWIDKRDWEYKCEFEAAQEGLSERRLDLVFDGLDTYADVYLNGHLLFSADNMFRAWKADVKPYIKLGKNELHVKFRSPIKEDLPKLEKLGYGLPAANDESEMGELGDQKLSVFARKAPYHYGWDWGPRFVTSGIWREVRLEGWSGPRIADLYVRQDEVTQQHANVTAVVEVESDADWEGDLRLSAEGKLWHKKVRLTPGLQTLELSAKLDAPKLWWSRGLGEQHQYTFTAALRQNGTIAAERSVRTGLRSVKLIRTPDEYGAAFYIELNGVPVFAKGANHIPNDSFVTEVTYERYKHEIASAAASNMNMLRVWGGGIYEQDAFYELCDEYGLLVWQDFMFACSMYPGDKAFLKNVSLEAEYNVKRLRNHPCIALWCGNNEIDVAWSQYNEEGGWGWKKQYTADVRDQIWQAYETVFHQILPEAVAQFSPGIDYWPSSPLAEPSGDAGQHSSNDAKKGDIHYWGVWHAIEPFENYNRYVGRFMSEYGFQSFPEYKTVRSYAEEDDMALQSEVMLGHQKNKRGNQIIKDYMDLYMPQSKDFPSFLYMSQLLQAEAMKTAIEAHRRKKPYCMGTLYWQMNDCWPVASWAGMDYFGRWKALQYYAKTSYQDVMLSIDGTSGDHVDIYTVSDKLEPAAATLHVSLLDLGGVLLKRFSCEVEIAAGSSQIVHSLLVEDLLQGRDPASVLLLAQLVEGGEIVDSKEHYFVTIQHLPLPHANITVQEVEGSDGTAFRLETDRLAKQVYLSASEEGIFSSNYFDLIPGFPRTVQFMTLKPGQHDYSPAKPGALHVSSMKDYIIG